MQRLSVAHDRLDHLVLAIATPLTLRAVFRLALRRTEGLIGSVITLLGLTLAMLGHSTLSHQAGTLEVPRPRPGSGPVFAADGAYGQGGVRGSVAA